MKATQPTVGPVQSGERIQVLDVLRGFAVFGILLVNMEFFGAPLYRVVTGAEWWPGTADRVAEWLIRFLAEAKFYSLFSFLFGLGFSLQMARAAARGVVFTSLHRRRVFGLMLIGLVHAFLVWYGDILVIYALMGLVLMLFRRVKDRTLVVWAVCLLMLPVALNAALAGLVQTGRRSPQMRERIERSFAESRAEYERRTEESVRAYGQGSYSELAAQRAQDVFFIYSVAIIRHLPNVLAMFLLGLYIGRKHMWENLAQHAAALRRVAAWGLLIGVPANAVFTVANAMSNPAEPSWGVTLTKLALALGAPALCFAYASVLVLLWEDERWCQRLRPLASVGRMALSNYLLHSLVCTTLFYSYGLALYGKVGPALGVLLTLGIYMVQVPLSAWWLARFRYGPAEWAWRSMTYGRLQPIRI